MKAAILLLTVILAFLYGCGQTAEDYINSGNAKADLEDDRGAIADCSKAIELKPGDADAYHSRGLVKLHVERKNSGCLDLSKAGELGHDEAYDAIKEHCN